MIKAVADEKGISKSLENQWILTEEGRILYNTAYAAIRHEDANKKHIQDFIESLKEELAQ